MDAAARYDWELAHVHHRSDADVPFLLGVAEAHPGPLLELACGTGRILEPLVAAGLDVTGLDLDPAMLAAARRRVPGAPLVAADMRHFALARRFAVVAVAYNSLQLLDRAGRLACLRTAADHLAPGGRLALEVTDFQAGVTSTSVPLRHLAGDEHLSIWGALEHDLEARRTTYHRRTEWGGRRRVDHVVLHALDEAAVRAELGESGLAVERVEPDGYRLRLVALRARRAVDGLAERPPAAPS